MICINKVTLYGRLGADPEVRNFQNGGQVCNLRLATSETWKDKQTGEQKERTEWHAIAIFNEHLIKVAQERCRKGYRIYVEGKKETRDWQDQNGNDRQSVEIVLRGFDGQLIVMEDKTPRSKPDNYGGPDVNTQGDYQVNQDYYEDPPF
ncbi:single-stranded DNA-binding protein [Henriciella pelagia]|uniref:single-stranded DNA-binding protein n=1 Tax=Henriciella pelagia TaxID=1977912 RepID=UPI00351620A3